MDRVADSASKRAIVIAGPTASGKSGLALALAERHGGVVINADSMQVYADLAILTARPTPAEMARVPHRLFGHVDAAEAYSVGRWLGEVAKALDEVAAEGRRAIVVGGTGLYLKALTEGLSDIPAVPPEIRAALRREAENLPPHALHARLAMRDPAMAARLRPSDPQRVLRALEVLETTGQSLLAYQAQRKPALLPRDRLIGICLQIARPTLNARIDARFDAMIANGALDEAERLLQRHLDPALPAMRALGVPQLRAVAENSMPLGEAIASAKSASRHYAKRQITFHRHQLPVFVWVDPAEALQVIERRMTDLSVQ